MSDAVTEGIRVRVRSDFRADRSDAAARRWLFTYTVRIGNEGAAPARLVARHWIITDATGGVDEVRGEGVVGQTPRLEPGEHFEYTSYCILDTPHGSMTGTYRMARDDGTTFDVAIAPFALVVPGRVN